eukprot:CAMPEP_0204607338 /NCGR_PEP_ID=MMETSP0661-20131031/59651_1 /ASSEMBLY_ACC=CAM_ASM_000606 /TAXON_ID=109239 /ORGANISM="Alexandrium margalefi, Strain AMGDE01CS-322" /LENGTH=169 /DNA_ID=CAMNT_0051618743 /DNA_START=78 /DNA_END=587 /DNA_ORIENTATION=+
MSWPPNDEVLSEYIEQQMSPKGKGRGEGLWTKPDEARYWYAIELAARASGAKEWGARFIIDAKRWDLKPFLDDEVKGAIKYIAEQLENQEPVPFGYREHLCVKGFANVVDELMKLNPGDKDLQGDLLKIVIFGCKENSNRGCFRATEIRAKAKTMAGNEMAQEVVKLLS